MSRIFLFILLILFIPINSFSQQFKEAANGIEYAELTREIDSTPVKMNLLRLDLTKVRLDVVHALDSAIGVERTSSVAVRHGAFAAINAGFFRLDSSIFAGDNVGILQIDGKLLSESSSGRSAILVKNQNTFTTVFFEHLNSSIFVLAPSEIVQITGINRQRNDNDVILYTPEFHRTTLTNPDGLEIIVRNERIVRIIDNQGSNLIPENGFVISVSGEKRQLFKRRKIGQKLRIGLPTGIYPHSEPIDKSNSKIVYSEDIVAGVPQLIKNGKIEITWEQEKSSKAFVETKHPRTAVAKLKDGKFLMITVDGRSESSGGIALPELAELLIEFGATDALNLDGGGSTTMFLDGKVVNHPSDKEGERKVSDVILVIPRKVRDLKP